MSLLVSIDPGLRACGGSIFHRGVLHKAALVVSPNAQDRGGPAWRAMGTRFADWYDYHCPKGTGYGIEQLWIEQMRIYPAARQRGDQNDLIELAGVAGYILSELCPKYPCTIFPRDWKGTLDPDDMIERVKERLSPEERAVVELPAASLAHNVWDSVGIGLHALGRLAPRHVYPR